jgi:hypothetical protein
MTPPRSSLVINGVSAHFQPFLAFSNIKKIIGEPDQGPVNILKMRNYWYDYDGDTSQSLSIGYSQVIFSNTNLYKK